MQCAFSGGSVAATARKSLESELGRTVISPVNANDLSLEQINKNKLIKLMRSNFLSILKI